MNQSISLSHKPLIALDSFLEDFIHTEKFTSSITCAETGKYLVLNQAISTREGIPLQDYLGLTVHDMAKIKNYKPAIVDNVITVNKQIRMGALPDTQYKQIIPIHDGSIYAEEVTKRPIYSKTRKKIIGILGYGKEVTPSLNLMYLFKMYQQYYPKKEAIQGFIRYMKLGSFFYELPTQRELEVLLTMKQSTASKVVAKILQRSPRTIDANKDRLRDHLKDITLGELVMKLRMHHELNEGVIG